MAHKNVNFKQQDVLGLMESAFRVASSQFQPLGGDPVANYGNLVKKTDVDVDVDVKKQDQISDTDQDLFTDKEIWVLNIPILYSPILINQEDFDEEEAATAQSRGFISKAKAENH